jgi:hypothetical protein
MNGSQESAVTSPWTLLGSQESNHGDKSLSVESRRKSVDVTTLWKFGHDH